MIYAAGMGLAARSCAIFGSENFNILSKMKLKENISEIYIFDL